MNHKLKIECRRVRNKFNHYRQLMEQIKNLEAWGDKLEKGELNEAIDYIKSEDRMALRFLIEAIVSKDVVRKRKQEQRKKRKK